jgi:hypothetical protein
MEESESDCCAFSWHGTSIDRAGIYRDYSIRKEGPRKIKEGSSFYHSFSKILLVAGALNN